MERGRCLVVRARELCLRILTGRAASPRWPPQRPIGVIFAMTDAAAASQARDPRLPLPTDPLELTPELLTRLIGDLHPGTVVTQAEVLESVGVGFLVSTAGRGKLRLTYAKNPHGLPERAQVKMIVGERSKVPPCVYETEVYMYRRMLPGLPVERATCLAAGHEPGTDNFVLLLEDLELRGAEFTNVLEPPYTPDQVGQLLDELAKLHARFWKSPRLDEEAGWLATHMSGRQFEMLNNGHIVRLLESHVAGSTYRQDLIERMGGHPPAKLWEMVKAVQRHQAATIPNTLCHGDTGRHNTYRLANGRLGFVDWQLSVKATWPHDVHYAIVTALSVRDRRRHERDLIQRYLDGLKANGVDYAPTLDEAMEAYSLAIVWGLVIGWFCVRPESYGMEIISANVERLLAAATDHDTLPRAEALL
jgi:hypothetical protein